MRLVTKILAALATVWLGIFVITIWLEVSQSIVETYGSALGIPTWITGLVVVIAAVLCVLATIFRRD